MFDSVFPLLGNCSGNCMEKVSIGTLVKNCYHNNFPSYAEDKKYGN